MRSFAMTIAAASLFAGAAMAQTTMQEGVIGESGNPDYPVQVQGANDVIYNCEAAIIEVNGLPARRCIPAGGAGLANAGAGVNGAAAGGVALVLLGIAAASGGGGGTSTTTTTN